MLKREIKFKNFDDEDDTEIAWFHLSKTELVEMEVENEDGLEKTIRRIIEADNRKALIAEFKRVILSAYGVKSEDGKRFIKSEELRTAFSQTAAFDTLFMELATDDSAAAEFINGIVPKDMKLNGTQTLPAPVLNPIEMSKE